MEYWKKLLTLFILIAFAVAPVIGEEYYGWDPQTGSSDDQISLEVTGIYDSTSCSLYDASSNSELASTTLGKGDIWTQETAPGDFIRLQCSNDVAPYLGDDGWAAKVYYPDVNGSFSGDRFVFQAIESNNDGATRFYAPEETASVDVTNLNDGTVSSFTVNSNRFQKMTLTGGNSYEVESDKKLIIENTAGNAFEMAPSANGGMKGQEFYGTTSNWERGAYAIFSYGKPVNVDVYSLTETGSSIYQSHNIDEDSRVYQSGTGVEEFRFVANDTISVWIGDTEGGNSISYMGDDFSMTRVEPGENKMIGAGRHSPNLVAMATENDTKLEVDGTTYEMDKNGFKQFSTSPPHTYNVSTNKPVITQFIAGNNLNDEGTYLLQSEPDGGLCDRRGPKNECISSNVHQISARSFEINSIFESKPSSALKSAGGASDITVNNRSIISGLWRGDINFTADEIVLKSGARFRPVNRIILNNR
ncbi:hypothetical protein ACK3SF_02215 [Candidatus Nanosalina sp. VS9-1]|uniref:hypothetical protein n=1 Tax=Candidatus Nanosalina sp. VS9-1 TaxID=3388566 RepID=UPI0039E02A46